MKKTRIKITIFLAVVVLLSSIRPVVAANDYAVEEGAYFRWDATKYFYMKDGLGVGNDLEYTYSYYMEFNFTNWGDYLGMDFLNGTLDINGTVVDGEISHEYYYSRQQFGQEWVTSILDTSNPAPVHVYLVCETEIDQTTRPDLQYLSDNYWINMTEPSTNNFSLTGIFVDNEDVTEYTGSIVFNSDKVLEYVFDELVGKDTGVIMYIERYEWTLTYIPGGEVSEPITPPSTIPGYSLEITASLALIGVVVLMIRKSRLIKIR